MRFFNLPPWDWLLVLGTVTGVYILQNFGLPLLTDSYLVTYVGRPILWGVLAFFILRLPRQKAAGRGSLRQMLLKIGFAVGFFQIYLAVVLGLLEGFGRSPHSFTLSGIAINLVFLGTNIIGVELSRAWLLNRLSRKSANLLLIFIAFFFAVFSLTWSQLPNQHSTLENWTKFLGSDFLPLYMESYLASYLALWGGVWPAAAYRAVVAGFYWFSPLLPNLNWALKALTGTVVPIVAVAVIEEGYLSRIAVPGKVRSNSEQSVVGWTFISLFTVISLWFCLGVFPFQPTAIVSGSMRPTLDVGDIVVVARRNPELLKPGDIIQFRGEDSSIPTVHRIISRKEEGGKPVFLTKGDANKGADLKLVPPEKVTGTVVFIVPKAGWVPITLRQIFSGGEVIKSGISAHGNT